MPEYTYESTKKVPQRFKWFLVHHHHAWFLRDSIKLTCTSLLCVIFYMMISVRIVGQNETMLGYNGFNLIFFVSCP